MLTLMNIFALLEWEYEQEIQGGSRRFDFDKKSFGRPTSGFWQGELYEEEDQLYNVWLGHI